MERNVKNYTDIGILVGMLDEIIEQLQIANENGKKAFSNFNGHLIYSDMTIDEMYIEVTGKTFLKYKTEKNNWLNEYNRKKEEHQNNIPQLTMDYIKRGHLILKHEFIDLWKKCVPIRLNDLYNGMELGCTLDIIELLNTGGTFEDAKIMLNKQNHSGMSYELMLLMLKTFHSTALYKYLKLDI